jgi:IPTL-CTERM motif
MRSVHIIGVIVFALGMAFGSARSLANTLSANVADYNAAQVTLAAGVLTVPANLATYSVTTAALTVSSTLVVTLPAGFTFGTAPSLSNTGTSTFTLSSGGVGSQSATFTVGAADLAVGQSVSLDTFAVHGATALETPIPVASALPVTMQSSVADSTPLTAPAFASDPGADAVFVGAIQFIDSSPPSNGTLFGTGTNDTATAVISAIAISQASRDAATQTVPVLSPAGTANTLAPTDTATVTMGGLFAGIATTFSSTTSDCTHPIATGTVSPTQLTIPNVALNTEVFLCATVTGTTRLQPNPGFTAAFGPGTSTDFLSGPVNNEFPGDWSIYGSPYPPTISKVFGGSTAALNVPTALTFTLFNPNTCNGGGYGCGGAPLSGVGFTDTLPAGLVVATPNGLSSDCGGTATAVARSSSVSLSGGSIDGGASCTVSLNVVGTTPGEKDNTTDPVTSTESGAGLASNTAALTIASPIPVLSHAGLAALALLLVGFGVFVLIGRRAV